MPSKSQLQSSIYLLGPQLIISQPNHRKEASDINRPLALYLIRFVALQPAILRLDSLQNGPAPSE